MLRNNKKISAIVPVTEDNDHHPLRAKKIKEGYLNEFIKTKIKTSSNRQDLEKCFFLCHNFWLIRTKSILENNGSQPWGFMGKYVKPFVIRRSIDIHDQLDLDIAKILIRNKKN